MSLIKVLQTVLSEVDAGRRVAVCTLVATRGSTPQSAPAMLCVDENATVTGTLGGGCVEADVRRQAHQLLADRRSALLIFKLDNDFGYDDGMICGGAMDIAVSVPRATDMTPFRDGLDRLRNGEDACIPIRVATDDGTVEYRIRLAARPTAVIAGAGHISRVLAGFLLPLDFAVHVIDDRAEYANAKRFNPPVQTHVGRIESVLEKWRLDPNTYVVIVTRGHKHDEIALRAVLDSPAKYVGMIGSRRKIEVIYNDLRHDGVTDEALARVHAPIGIDINAVTVEEIALSIAAELVSIHRADHREGVEGPIPVSQEST